MAVISPQHRYARNLPRLAGLLVACVLPLQAPADLRVETSW
jgi:hypothetical protein